MCKNLDFAAFVSVSNFLEAYHFTFTITVKTCYFTEKNGVGDLKSESLHDKDACYIRQA